MTRTLSQLENQNDFITRHIGPSPQQQEKMLQFLGAGSLPELIDAIVPQDIRDRKSVV